jgi:hypothetical protein
MRRIFSIVVLILALALPTFAADAHDKALVEKVKTAVALLYSQDESGGMKMHCTATAFEKVKDGYNFVSAAHCVGNDDVAKEKAASPTNIPFFITFDEENGIAKRFYPANVVFVGYQHRGEDFSVFHVKTSENWPTIPIGDETKEQEGSSFINIASPLGLGKQVMYGTISKMFLDRPVVSGDINWKGTLVLQIPGVQGGSSGSALVADDQGAIVGFLVGSIGDGTIVAIPVTRFTAVKKAVDAKKYKWYSPDAQLNPDGTEKQQ